MPDNKKKQGYQDDAKIAEDEISYWAKKFGVTASQIRNAIIACKSHAASKVKLYLKSINLIK